MTLVRATIAITQLVLNQLATRPPHKAPQKGRYKTKAHRIFSIAPLVFWLQRPLLYLDTCLELLTITHTFYLATNPQTRVSRSTVTTPFCPTASANHSPANLYVTPISFLGIVLVVAGTFIRLWSYKALGSLFTFDLCVKPGHRLVTTGPYSFVRHPAYLGSLCLIAGLTFTGLTGGSWIIECGVPASSMSHSIVAVVAASWWTYTAGVGWTRCIAEDKQMKELFPQEWETYAGNVRYWFVPGLI